MILMHQSSSMAVSSSSNISCNCSAIVFFLEISSVGSVLLSASSTPVIVSKYRLFLLLSCLSLTSGETSELRSAAAFSAASRSLCALANLKYFCHVRMQMTIGESRAIHTIKVSEKLCSKFSGTVLTIQLAQVTTMSCSRLTGVIQLGVYEEQS